MHRVLGQLFPRSQQRTFPYNPQSLQSKAQYNPSPKIRLLLVTVHYSTSREVFETLGVIRLPPSIPVRAKK